MSHLLLCPAVVVIGIFGFLIANQAVALPALIGAALLVPTGVAAQLRKKRQHS
ncbi:hypothetical protein SGFS_011080 [Streptomyces graminofaciens]|jgi:hypothetical protein|uniref:Uncharacterized protein n=1 Tax=Streptomyces graminofaciens TaxID=68212 RepID=A0ABM7F256_9ACTN|nr:hypothetical protein [Streptomyces graminofaciens]BBC29814.1 hypothetical protein SGFS_011080 [Streptomyces graminofaciens]